MQSLWNRSITKWAYCAAFCLSLFLLTPSQASADDVRPQITDFTWSNPWANYFVFYGTVSDDLPEGCLVKFGGLIEGAAATVYEDGSFCFLTEFPEGTNGEVFAICMDIHGNLSEIAFTFIF